jgi:cytochrome P450
MSPFPRLTQSKAWHCRERVQAATTAYYTAKHDQHPSVAPFMRARAAALRGAGLTDEDIGRIEFFQFGAATGNSSATLMWFIFHVFGCRETVERIRDEVVPLLREESLRDGRVRRTMNLAQVEEKCQFLLACWKETLRVVNVHTSVRRVKEDTYVADGNGTRYLLKKGCDVMMPHAVAHRNGEVWGHGVEFRPENFLPSVKNAADPKASAALEKARRAGWIPFGGGANLCPGRRIAMVEHLAFVATMVCGFEVKALDGGEMKRPEVMPMGLGHAILRPVEEAPELRMRVKRRVGWEDVEWSYELGNAAKA